MQVTRIGWAGTGTGDYSAMVQFLTAVLGLTLAREAPDFAVLDCPQATPSRCSAPATKTSCTSRPARWGTDRLPITRRTWPVPTPVLPVHLRWGLGAGSPVRWSDGCLVDLVTVPSG
jgi:hypothetical protein